MIKQKTVSVTLLNDNRDFVSQEVKINKLITGNYAGLMKVMGRVTKELLKNDNSDVLDGLAVGVFGQDAGIKYNDDGTIRLMDEGDINQGLLKAALFLFANATEEFYDLVSVLTDLEPNFIARLEEESLFKLLEAVLEVNDFEKVFRLGKNFFKTVTGTYKKRQGLDKKNENNENQEV